MPVQNSNCAIINTNNSGLLHSTQLVESALRLTQRNETNSSPEKGRCTVEEPVLLACVMTDKSC